MYEIGLIIYSAAIVAACYLSWDAFKHRFLPIARPLIGLSIILALVCMLRLLGLLDPQLSQWLMQAIEDFEYFLIHPLVIPLWIWALLEYYQDKKISLGNKILLIFFIQPSIVITLWLTDIVTNGFLSQASAVSLIDPKDRLGAYVNVRHVYGTVVIVGLILLTPYLVRKRQQSPLSDLLLVMLTMVVPYILHVLYRDNWISLSLGAPAFILFILWGSRQYRLLDVMPVALQGVIDKMDSGIIVGNVHSKLLYVNGYAQQLFDISLTPASALQQRKLSMPEVFEQHFNFSSPEKQTALMQVKSRLHNGAIRYINATLQPIFSPKLNKHLGATVSFHDITERKQAELELESYNRQKSEFFAGISHEFRTPLTLSMGNIDDVLHDLNKVPVRQLEAPLKQARANNKRLLGLVNQLLELSRLDRGALTIKPVKLNLSNYLPMLIANFESLAENHNIKLHFEVSGQARQDSSLYFDTDALDKVVINLLSNALKSITGNAGGEVVAGLDHGGDSQLQLTVRDTGCGIATDALPHIFEMFYSHQMNNAVWPQSTGVGLSLVKQLLVLHGADIEVNSIEGEGTCFTVTFRRGYAHFSKDVVINHHNDFPDDAASFIPESATIAALADLPDDSPTPVPVKYPAQSGGKPMILLAEDNADMRRYIRKHLGAFELLEAADGERGLELARQSMPDLVLSDVMMPKMNGYELCAGLKSDSQTSHIPVVLLTAKSDQSERLEGLSLGADDYLSKPFDVRELNLRINNLISARRTIQVFYQNNGLEKVIGHPDLPKRETTFLEKIQSYVREHIDNSEIKVSDLAEVVHMSERSLSRKLKALTGDTPKQMLMTIRMEQAARLLTHSDSNITRLSYDVGFTDASHFTRSFKKHYGMTPTEYRERH